VNIAGAPRNLQQPQQRQKLQQTIVDHERTLGHHKKLPTGKSEPTHAFAGPSSAQYLRQVFAAMRLRHDAYNIPVNVKNAPPKRGISVEVGCVSRPLNLSSVKEADRQPLVTTGGGGGYLPIGALPTGYLPTGAAAGGGGSLRGRSAAAAAPSIAKDAAAAVRIFSMM
jgi:hypothetical protein